MLRTVQSNIDDRHRGGDPFSESVLRSVTVFALGSSEAVAEPATLSRIRDRALELLGSEPDAEATARFTGSGAGALETGGPFGVEIAGHEAHLVRAVDGPLEDEDIAAIRLIGNHRWV